MSWETHIPPDWLLKALEEKGFTGNTDDWRYHGVFEGAPGTVTCAHRGLREPGEVAVSTVTGDEKVFCAGKCDICGMVHWLEIR